MSSELEISDIPEMPGNMDDEADVEILFGEVPDHLNNIVSSGVLFETSPGEFLLKLPNVGKFLALNGKKIIVDPRQEATKDEINLFLLGSVFGAILHQRGVLPLHGSTISADNHAIVIIGNSAAGKSTLAASLNEMGYSIISDDISAVSLNSSGDCRIHPGIPYLKLWKDVVDILHPETNLNKVRPQIEKYKVPVNPISIKKNDHLIKKIVLLSTKNEEGFSVTEITGAGKLKILRENIYRDQVMKGLGLMENHFQILAKLGNQSKLFCIERPSSPLRIKELSEFFINRIIKLENV